MFRDKMKISTTVLLALSFLMGELSLSVPGVAFASNQTVVPVSSAQQTAARWVRCNVDGDMDADDWCWVPNARAFLPEGKLVFRNGVAYVVRNGKLVLRNRFVRRNRVILQGGFLVQNGYIMNNGQIVGYVNNLGKRVFYFYP